MNSWAEFVLEVHILRGLQLATAPWFDTVVKGVLMLPNLAAIPALASKFPALSTFVTLSDHTEWKGESTPDPEVESTCVGGALNSFQIGLSEHRCGQVTNPGWKELKRKVARCSTGTDFHTKSCVVLGRRRDLSISVWGGIFLWSGFSLSC